MAAPAKNTAPKKAPKNEATPAPEGQAPDNSNLGLMKAPASFYWMKDKVDEDSGEIIRVDKYKYIEGQPKQYRVDNKEGQFNLNGVKKLGDSFTFQPIAWRVFEDDILTMGLKQWIELFFIDEKDCVSAILFHSYSCENLLNLAEPLFYDDISLADVVITAKLEKHENKAVKATYYIAEFSYEDGDPEKTKELKAYAKEHKLYRRATLTPNANFTAVHRFHNPLEDDSELLEEETSADAA